MPIAVCGMHRSGTSMITNLLRRSGLYLGAEQDLITPKSDNPTGFWENIRFLAINEKLLTRMNGAWDMPPPEENLSLIEANDLPERAEAAELLKSFDSEEPWGWKDPRTSLTLRFWRRMIPDLAVIICIRNPLEVYMSLARRNNTSLLLSLTLWFKYNMILARSVEGLRAVITHYESYFADPAAELRRVTDAVGIKADDDAISDAASAVDTTLRHNAFTHAQLAESGVSANVIKLYDALCGQAGAVFSGVEGKR